MRTTLGGALRSIGFDAVKMPIRGLDLVKGDFGILERGKVAIEHSRGANLAAYSVLAGDHAVNLRVSRNNNVVNGIKQAR